MEEENNNCFTTSFVSLAQVSFEDADIPVALAVHPGEPFGNDAKLDQAIKEAKNRKCLYKTGIVSAAEYSTARVRQRLIENDRFRSQFPHAEQPPWAAQMVLTMAQMDEKTAQMEQSMAQMEQNMVQMGQNMVQMGQNLNQMGQNMNQMGQDIAAVLGQNMNQMGQDIAAVLGQNMNQMGQNMNDRFAQMDQRMTFNTINVIRRTKNAFFFQVTTEEPLRGIVKEFSGVGPGLPNHPVLAVPNPVAVGQIPPGFPTARIAFDSLTHAQLSMLSAQYNHTFGIVATDDLGSCRNKFKVFTTEGYYLE
jgi:hypothetical protein